MKQQPEMREVRKAAGGRPPAARADRDPTATKVAAGRGSAAGAGGCRGQQGCAGNPPSLRQTFSRNLRRWRSAVGAPLKAVAAQLGVAPSTWSQWESGRRFPAPEMLDRLSRIAGLQPAYFLCEEDHLRDLRVEMGENRSRSDAALRIRDMDA